MPYINTHVPELSGFDTGLCLNNLATLAKRHNTQQESLLAVLSELADAILADSGGDPDTVILFYSLSFAHNFHDLQL